LCFLPVRKPIIESGHQVALNARAPEAAAEAAVYEAVYAYCGRSCSQHVAALTERAQILHPIVARVAIQVRSCEHNARHPKPSRLHKIGPSGRALILGSRHNAAGRKA
jgi:hypothetical protein